MSIKTWPKAERPRERLIARGAQALSDAELLAVLFGSGTRGESAVDIARDLLNEFGSLRALLSAKSERLLQQKGLGPARYSMLQAALEITRRHYSEDRCFGPELGAPESTQAFLLAQLRDRPYEMFCCLYFDARNRLIKFDELFRGTLEGANVHPREVVREALAHNAKSVIFAHNHPSGSLEPSPGDSIITRRLKDALGHVDVNVLDHVIVGDSGCLSFAEQGLL